MESSNKKFVEEVRKLNGSFQQLKSDNIQWNLWLADIPNTGHLRITDKLEDQTKLVQIHHPVLIIPAKITSQ